VNIHSQEQIVRNTGVKSRIDRAAVELFAARGIDGVSIADIASRAGVSQGALYRHYPSKDALAGQLFAAAYRRTGAELAAIRLDRNGFARRIEAMVGHFCALYDDDPALFRFMLLAQHDLLPRIEAAGPAPVEALKATLADAVTAGEIVATDPTAAAAAVMGIVLQTALFHIYGRLVGPLGARAPALARAAIAAVSALPPNDTAPCTGKIR
jgi:AcrR family transcriptional regulator